MALRGNPGAPFDKKKEGAHVIFKLRFGGGGGGDADQPNQRNAPQGRRSVPDLRRGLEGSLRRAPEFRSITFRPIAPASHSSS